MPVGRQGKGIFFGEKKASIQGKCGHHSLLKEEDGILRISEKVMLVEKRAGLNVVVIAGHDVPGNHSSGVAARARRCSAKTWNSGLFLTGVMGYSPLGPS